MTWPFARKPFPDDWNLACRYMAREEDSTQGSLRCVCLHRRLFYVIVKHPYAEELGQKCFCRGCTVYRYR